MFFLLNGMYAIIDLVNHVNKRTISLMSKIVILILSLFADYYFYSNVFVPDLVYLLIPIYFLTDIISGFVHWFGDNFDCEPNSIIKKKLHYDFFFDFQNHHNRPFDIWKEKTYMYNVESTFYISIFLFFMITFCFITYTILMMKTYMFIININFCYFFMKSRYIFG